MRQIVKVYVCKLDVLSGTQMVFFCTFLSHVSFLNRILCSSVYCEFWKRLPLSNSANVMSIHLLALFWFPPTPQGHIWVYVAFGAAQVAWNELFKTQNLHQNIFLLQPTATKKPTDDSNKTGNVRNKTKTTRWKTQPIENCRVGWWGYHLCLFHSGIYLISCMDVWSNLLFASKYNAWFINTQLPITSAHSTQ